MDEHSKTAVITGANTGLGLACAEEIARDPRWRVLLACRDPVRGQKAAAEVARRTGNPRVQALALDLAALKSVRHFAGALEGPIHALVLNAGVQLVTERTRTEDGFETTFAVNHLGHFLLANLLLGKMARGGRIVFVASNTHDPARWTGMPAPRFVDPFQLASGDSLSEESPGTAGRRRYTTSKLCNVLCAYEMHRRVSATSRPNLEIAINAFDPGLMPATQLSRDYGFLSRMAAKSILPLLTLLVPNTNRVRTSARRLARLVVDPSCTASGRYFSRGRDTPSSTESYDQQKAYALWEASAELTQLTAEDSPLATKQRPS